MHYGIIAVGSRGDVQPFVALSLGLQDRGHTVTLMAHENFKAFIEGYNIPFRPLAGDVREMLYTPEGFRILKSGSLLKFMRFIRDVVAKNQDEVNKGLIAGAEKADVLVTSLLGLIWIDAIAETSQKPYATIQLSFPSTPTREFPFPLLDFFDFPAYNRLTYKIFADLYSKDYKQQLNTFRQSLNLPPIKGSILKKIAEEKQPNIYAISPALLPRPADWDPTNHVTGFINLPPQHREKNPQDAIPPGLTDWLKNITNDKPIYIGFGSIPVPDPEKFLHILDHLLAETNYRFIFCQGWSQLDNLPEHPNLFVTQTVNHDWLFPRCRAAIIHGGIGTLQTALRAKLPLVIAALVADQPWWGKLIQKRGLGTYLPFRKWTTEKILTALRATDNPDIKNRVDRIGNLMTKEDGLACTISTLENYFSTHI